MQECQQAVTSEEFVDHMIALDRMEWEEKSKWEYYMAELLALVHNFHQSWTERPSWKSRDDFFLKSEGEKEGEVSAKVETSTIESLPTSYTIDSPRVIETGPSAVKDPKWAAVNDKAKTAWAMRMGVAIPNAK